MYQPNSACTNVPKRTLTSLKEEIFKFHLNDGNVHDAKRFHNVIYQNLFDVSIDQVNNFFVKAFNKSSFIDKSLASYL